MTDELPILPITPEEEAWLIARCAELDRLAAGVELGELPATCPGFPIVFLDFDDVLCLNEHVGGLDALDALRGKRLDTAFVFRNLWSARAVAILRGIHVRFGGRLRYVISSSWRRYYTRPQIIQVMHRSGLEFVAGSLEVSERWATPVMPTKTRAHEVLAWLQEHHRGEPHVVIDDECSGSELKTYSGAGAELLKGRVVLCEEWAGLWPAHYPRIVAALSTPCPRDV